MSFASSIVDRATAGDRLLDRGGSHAGTGTLRAWQKPDASVVFDLLESAEFKTRHAARELAGKLALQPWHVTGTTTDGDLLLVGLRLPGGSYQLAVKAAPGLRLVGITRNA